MTLSEKFTDKLLEMQIIKDEEKDIYSYGFKQGIILLINMITMIIIGLLFNMIWESIIFMVSYSFLRVYAGGYHANSNLSCYLFSVAMMAAVLWLIKLIPWNSFICSIIAVVTSMIILLLAPVEDNNKPLDKKEKEVFKKRTNIVLGILTGFTITFWVMDKQMVSICIVMGVTVLSVMLVLGKVKNMYIGTVNSYN